MGMYVEHEYTIPEMLNRYVRSRSEAGRGDVEAGKARRELIIIMKKAEKKERRERKMRRCISLPLCIFVMDG